MRCEPVKIGRPSVWISQEAEGVATHLIADQEYDIQWFV